MSLFLDREVLQVGTLREPCQLLAFVSSLGGKCLLEVESLESHPGLEILEWSLLEV